MSVSAVKVPAIPAVRTIPSARTMLERQLLARAQSLAMVIIAITANLALAIQMVLIADFLDAHALEESANSCCVWAGKIGVQTFFVGVEDDGFAGWRLFGGYVDVFWCVFADGCP